RSGDVGALPAAFRFTRVRNRPGSFGFEDDRTMSRIGRKPVPVPPSVKVWIAEKTVEIEGPKGKLSFKHRPEIDVAFDKAAQQILVSRHDDERINRSLHGLTR